MPISFNLLTVQEVNVVIDWSTTLFALLFAFGGYIVYHRLNDRQQATTTFTSDQSAHPQDPVQTTHPEGYFRHRLDFRRVVRRHPRVR